MESQTEECRDQKAENVMLENISHFTCRLGNGAGGWRLFFFCRRFFKNHEMLLRKDVEGLLPDQADLGDFLDRLFLGHLVEELDGNGRIFHSVFYQDQPSFLAKSVVNGLSHFAGMGKFVVGIDNQYAIDRVGW